MKKIALMTVALAAISTPALAQNSAALCKIYAQQGGSASVPANYQPGVDVNGNPVVYADGGMAAPISAPGSVRIPVTIDLAQRLGLPVPGGVELDAPVGVASIAGNGAVSFNGMDITAQTAALCAQPYVPTESANAPKAHKAAASSSVDPNTGFDYDAAWSPSKAAAAGIPADAAPVPVGVTAPSAPLETPAAAPMYAPAPQTVIPAESSAPSLADEPAYTPPAVVPAAADEAAAEERPEDVMGNAAAGGAVHTPAPAEPVQETPGAVNPQSGLVTEQDGIIYGEGQ